MSALLKGKALEVYTRLDEEDAGDYNKLKTALLRKYELTVEGFRKKFYGAIREKEETASQFVSSIEGYLDRWIQLAGIDKTFEGLKDLVVREQFLAVCDDRLTIYLRERDPKCASDLVKLADMYLDARLLNDNKEKRWYKESQHLKGANVQSTDAVRRRNGYADRPVTDSDRRVCFICREVGHVRRNCPKKQRGVGRPETVAACREVACAESQPCQHDLSTPGSLRLVCGCQLPFVGCLNASSQLELDRSRLSVIPGKVNGREVSVLRDTGCTSAVIRDDLVHNCQRTGNMKYYRVLDGTVGRAEVAVVDVESPVFSGQVECLCLKFPISDLIIGNVPGASAVNAPEVVAVSTRAQSVAEGKAKRSLEVPILQDLQVSRADVQRMQGESQDLTNILALLIVRK